MRKSPKSALKNRLEHKAPESMGLFKKKFPGKWVLTGEYSVLRSCPALAYPLPRYYIGFGYKKSDLPLRIQRKGKYQAGLELSAAPLFEKALKMAGKKRDSLKGALSIEGFIPFGAGLGASAAMSAGMASLFAHKGWIKRKQLKEFAVSLEDFFHGKSSGMDVAVTLKGEPILYRRGKAVRRLPKFKSKPNLFLSYSGGRAPTSAGMAKVRKFFKKSRKQSRRADEDMALSAKLCLQAMKEENKAQSDRLLARALSLGNSCFQTWGLISYDLERHIHFLKNHGALALKPTGSGLGGHVISLWSEKPPASIKKDLLPLEV